MNTLKTFIVLIFLGILGANSFLLAQNLVQNPSFEEYESCPEYLGSVRSYNPRKPEGIVHNWLANPSTCTPDYFHSCGKKGFKVPKNVCGEMEAYEGDGYVGMIVRIGEAGVYNMQDLYYREHITTKLRDSLRRGYLYRVSFWVSLAEYSNFAVQNIGGLLTDKPYTIHENETYEPQINSQIGLISTKNQWIEIADTLIAKGGERYLTLGNFESYKDQKTSKISQSTQYIKKFNYNRAYYYIDMVSVQIIGKAQPPITPLISQKGKITFESDFGKIEMGKPVILKNIYFDFDKADLLPESMPELQKLRDFLKKETTIQIQITGHTDSIGTTQKNILLSEQRAKSVLEYLVLQGVDSKRLKSKGLGETQPIQSNEEEEGRQQNRRVEFVVLPKE